MSNAASGDVDVWCLKCRYPLRGLTEARCPECGTAFDPEDPRTMWRGRTPGATARWLLSPPGRPLNWTAAVAAVGMLYAASVPGGIFVLFVLAPQLWVLTAGVWFTRVLLWIVVAWYYERPLLPAGRAWRSWLAAPVLAIVTTGSLWLDVPMHVRFMMSRAALDRVAQQVVSRGEAPFPQPQWIGWYAVDDVDCDESGVLIWLRGSGLLDRVGLYWAAHLPPQDGYGFHYRHLSGPWYVVIEDF